MNREDSFFIEAQIVKENSNESVLPIFWSDNYISLLPGEKRVISVEYDNKLLNNQNPLIKISGINIK